VFSEVISEVGFCPSGVVFRSSWPRLAGPGANRYLKGIFWLKFWLGTRN